MINHIKASRIFYKHLIKTKTPTFTVIKAYRNSLFIIIKLTTQTQMYSSVQSHGPAKKESQFRVAALESHSPNEKTSWCL